MAVMKSRGSLQTCLVALLLSLIAVGVQAQDSQPSATPTISAEKQALIKEMLELSNPKKTIDAMLKAQADQMEKQLPDIIWQAVSGMKELESLTPRQRAEVREQVVARSLRSGRRMYELITQKIDFNKLIEDISIPLYDKYFSESELRDLLAFHKSSTGKKVIEVMPQLLTESITRTSESIVPKITELMSQVQAEETQLATQEIQTAVKKISRKPADPAPKKRRRH
jgi:hypothetical protein